MRSQRIVRLREPPRVTVVLAEGDLDEIIQCIANVADRAESAAYDVASTPRAKTIARERAKRLYELASRLERCAQSPQVIYGWAAGARHAGRTMRRSWSPGRGTAVTATEAAAKPAPGQC
jgi:hypothetical protein